MQSLAPFSVPPTEVGQTLAAVLRGRLPGLSWRQVRQLIDARRVKVLDELCLDPARRLQEGNTVELLARSLPRARPVETVTLRYLDEHLVVVEKPSGICTVRHPLERAWTEQRKALSPTLEDLVLPLLNRARHQPPHAPQPRLRIVQRLDKETSGLLVFARSVLGERELGKQFRAHTVIRRYLALVPGRAVGRTLHTWLVRDRGDGRRGSTTIKGVGKEAITHVEVVERLPGYTLLGCRLETGRTHQIRIHLAEQGHPVCGDRVYCHRPDGSVSPDPSGAPRLALHAAELGFTHPVSGAKLHWSMPLPADLQTFLDRLREQPRESADAHPDQVD